MNMFPGSHSPSQIANRLLKIVMLTFVTNSSFSSLNKAYSLDLLLGTLALAVDPAFLT